MLNDVNDPLSFSLTQGLLAMKEQLNIDINDIMNNIQLMNGDYESFFNNFDINNPEISNLLQTPPTMGSKLPNFGRINNLMNRSFYYWKKNIKSKRESA